MNNSSAHGSEDPLLFAEHIEVVFVSQNTTGWLQTVKEGIVTEIKMGYRQKHMEHATNIFET